jgi:NTP pyrophosphatase (non-canonical NTP hydrolase)
MGEYLHSGKQVVHRELVGTAGFTHIADAGDVEKAHFLATAANAFSFDYAAEAVLTLSPSYHGELVAAAIFAQRLDAAIAALQALDEVKKSLFYGRDNGIASSQDGVVSNGTSDLPSRIADAADGGGIPFGPLSLRQATDYIHGALGLATEAGEMLEALRDAIAGKGVDPVNVKEESGDAKWYLAILSMTFGYGWRDDEAVNIAKLRARFPERFTEYDATNRNLTGERDILEQSLPANHRTRRMDGERSQDGAAIEAQKPAI